MFDRIQLQYHISYMKLQEVLSSVTGIVINLRLIFSIIDYFHKSFLIDSTLLNSIFDFDSEFSEKNISLLFKFKSYLPFFLSQEEKTLMRKYNKCLDRVKEYISIENYLIFRKDYDIILKCCSKIIN